MKLAQEQINVISSGIESKSNFSIKSNLKAFKILSDQLYSDKIKAVIRELSTNASDEHRLCNKADVPFDVYLPTHLEQNFIVRDYGRGLSHEDCTKLYTTYFDSTKTNENISTGCLGLGSKSPFAYNDSFYIESIHNGVKNIYVAVMESNGPTLNLLSSEKTEEHSGMLIKVPVKSSDITTFRVKAAKVYTWFDTTPNIYPQDIVINKIVKSDKNYLLKNIENHTICMGQVAYRLDINQLENEEVKSVLINLFNTNINNLVLFADIGSLDITPSRESLSYNKATIQYIENLLIQLLKDVEEEFKEEIKECKSIYQVYKKCYYSNNPFAKFGIEFNGEKISKKYSVQNNKFFRYNNYTENLGECSSFQLNDISYTVLDDIQNKKLSKKIIKSINRYNNNLIVFKGTIEEFKAVIGAIDEDDIVIGTLSKVISELGLEKVLTANIPCKKYNKNLKCFERAKMSVKYDNAVYIEENRGKFRIGSFWHSSSNIIYKLEELLSIINSDINIYTVKPSKVKDLHKRKNWKSINKIIEDYVEEFYSKNKDIIDNHFKDIYFREYETAKIISETSSKKDEIKKIIDTYEQNKVNKKEPDEEQLKVIEFAHKLCGLSFSCKFQRNYIDLGEKFTKIVSEAYPLLSNFSRIDRKVLNYIKQLDELESLRKRFKDEVCNK